MESNTNDILKGLKEQLDNIVTQTITNSPETMSILSEGIKNPLGIRDFIKSKGNIDNKEVDKLLDDANFEESFNELKECLNKLTKLSNANSNR